MFVDYKDLPDNARVFIYPCSRKFYPQEIDDINKKITQFIFTWKQEDEDFKTSYQLLHNRFIIFLIDEKSKLTNADIDKKVAFILQLEEEYNITLLDKMNVSFKQGDFIQYKDVKDFKKLIKNKSVNDKTIVFDNLIQTKYDLENYWEVPITESWYSRFL